MQRVCFDSNLNTSLSLI